MNSMYIYLVLPWEEEEKPTFISIYSIFVDATFYHTNKSIWGLLFYFIFYTSFSICKTTCRTSRFYTQISTVQTFFLWSLVWRIPTKRNSKKVLFISSMRTFRRSVMYCIITNGRFHGVMDRSKMVHQQLDRSTTTKNQP